MSKKVIIHEGQTIFDLVIQEYGSLDGLRDFLDRNDQIDSIETVIEPGTELEVGEPYAPKTAKSFADRNYKIKSKHDQALVSGEQADDGIFSDEFGEEFG